MSAAFLSALVGGVVIGVAASLLALFNGRIAGISGILGDFLGRSGGAWRALFLLGLVAGGVVARFVAPGVLGAPAASTIVLAVAGLCVGVGTQLGNGCTSGHGVCGIARGSQRSFVATVTFMAVAAAVVFVVRHGAAQ